MEPVGKMLYAERVEETAYSILRSGIACAGWKSRVAGDGNDPDDRALRLQQIWKRIFGAIDCAPEIHVHEPPYYGQIQVPEHRPHGDAGVVDEDVYSAELFHSPIYQGLAVFLQRNVRLDTQHFGLVRGEPCGLLLKLVQMAGGHHDFRSQGKK